MTACPHCGSTTLQIESLVGETVPFHLDTDEYGTGHLSSDGDIHLRATCDVCGADLTDDLAASDGMAFAHDVEIPRRAWLPASEVVARLADEELTWQIDSLIGQLSELLDERARRTARRRSAADGQHVSDGGSPLVP